MSKVVDITEKLSFDTNPKLVVKGKDLEVNADAVTILKIMGIVGEGNGTSMKDVAAMYELLFAEKARKEIEKFKLSIDDFRTVVSAAISLVIGEDDQGEQ